MKTLVVVCKRSRKIICVVFCNRKKHDFKLFTEAKIRIREEIEVQADTGFVGIKELHKNSTLPHKNPKEDNLRKTKNKKTVPFQVSAFQTNTPSASSNASKS